MLSKKIQRQRNPHLIETLEDVPRFVIKRTKLTRNTSVSDSEYTIKETIPKFDYTLSPFVTFGINTKTKYVDITIDWYVCAPIHEIETLSITITKETQLLDKQFLHFLFPFVAFEEIISFWHRGASNNIPKVLLSSNSLFTTSDVLQRRDIVIAKLSCAFEKVKFVLVERHNDVKRHLLKQIEHPEFVNLLRCMYEKSMNMADGTTKMYPKNFEQFENFLCTFENY